MLYAFFWVILRRLNFICQSFGTQCLFHLRRRVQNNKLIKRILAYSAKKIEANPPPPYSISNPETSSDSPSAKSKGVRLVSAKQEINQINDTGRERKINLKQTLKKKKTKPNYMPKFRKEHSVCSIFINVCTRL